MMPMSQHETKPKIFILAIAGGSGSGKTTLAKKMLQRFGPTKAAIIGQDSYYFDQSDRFDQDGGEINFDHPSSLDFQLLAQHLSELKRGNSIEIPVYDFVTHKRSGHIEKLSPHSVIIIDGTLILSQPNLQELIDYSVFLDVPEEVRLSRRLKRDVEERGRTEDGVMTQFRNQVKPMHDKYVQPSSKTANLVIPMVYNDKDVYEIIRDAVGIFSKS